MQPFVLVLALAGVVVSAVFLVQSRRAGTSCAAVAATPQGTLFLVPNVVWGIVWYAAVGAFALVGGPAWACWAFVAGAVAALAVGVYLVHALVVVLRIPCALCFTGHGVNAALLGALVLAC